MSRRKPLTCESKKVCIVIRKDKVLLIPRIEEYCKQYFDRYAFIEHRNDIDVNTGFVIPPHYHIVGEFKDSRVAFSTRLNQICDFFHFDNANGIEIDQYNTFEGSLQYLTHKNQKDKTQHDSSEIFHNLSQEDFKIFYNAEVGNVITFDLMYGAVLNAHNIIDVIREIGISNYRTWRNVIWDIWRTIQSDESYINKI